MNNDTKRKTFSSKIGIARANAKVSKSAKTKIAERVSKSIFEKKKSGSMQPIDLDQARKLADRSIPEDKISRSWQVCETLFPEQRRAFSVHANSPLTLCSVWATASLFQTSAHTPARLQLLATFATMVFARSSNWFAGDAKTTMISGEEEKRFE